MLAEESEIEGEKEVEEDDEESPPMLRMERHVGFFGQRPALCEERSAI